MNPGNQNATEPDKISQRLGELRDKLDEVMKAVDSFLKKTQDFKTAAESMEDGALKTRESDGIRSVQNMRRTFMRGVEETHANTWLK
ncbi:hypothetical protein OCU04_008005 [Sclerotinia nivalis]|uniref:Uncharacterized protein n=1 Tax=Sclerotinia nivalis TaxID=352851 RepID=A0A9X0AH69_9HELO|nr:hypothetical protein OCU04_008005 [Sclerotinia nivalis]